MGIFKDWRGRVESWLGWFRSRVGELLGLQSEIAFAFNCSSKLPKIVVFSATVQFIFQLLRVQLPAFFFYVQQGSSKFSLHSTVCGKPSIVSNSMVLSRMEGRNGSRLVDLQVTSHIVLQWGSRCFMFPLKLPVITTIRAICTGGATWKLSKIWELAFFCWYTALSTFQE